MSSGSIRIIQLPEKSSVNTDDYMAVDSSANGTKKVKFTDLLDNNLSAQNKAADAQATGEAISGLNTDINTEKLARQSTDNNLQLQIDQLVAPSGTAPNPAEIENARIGADGVTYDTLGNAIRTQVTDLKSALSEVGDYIYRDETSFKPEWEAGAINNEGAEEASSSHCRTGLYLLKKGDTFSVTRTDNFRVFYYNLDGTFNSTLYSVEANTEYDFGDTILVRFREAWNQYLGGYDWFNQYLTITKHSVENSYDNTLDRVSTLEASIDNSAEAQTIANEVFNAIDGNSLVFVHFTDSHVGRSEMPPTRAKAHMEKAIRLAEAVNADFLIHSGDMIQGNGSSTGTSDLERYQSMMGLVSKSAIPFVWCQGNCNHDFGLIVDGAYTLRRTQVSTLAGRLHRHISPIYNNADIVSNTFKASWEVGAINNSGAEEESTSHQRTGYYLLKRGETFRVMRDDLRVFFYNLDKTFKDTLYTTEVGKYYVMSEDTYVRFRAYYSSTQPQYGLGWMNEYLTLYKSEIVNSYYYFDMPTQHARVIVLDSDDYGGNRDSWGWSSTQIAWLTATLTDAKNNGLPVLIFSHMPPSGNLMPSCPDSGADVMSAVNAFTASGGTVLAFISGHVHWDNYYNDAINNVPYISMTCDLPEMSTEQFVPTWGTKVVPTRVIGEESEYAVDIYLINCMTKHTQIFRYGAGNDREFNY